MRKFLFQTTDETSASNELALTILRVTLGLMMAILHGLGKVPPSEKFIEAIASLGFPSPAFFAWGAGLAEFIGGILIALGFFTRPAALFLAITMLVAAFGKHLADPLAMKELALLYLAMALVFVVRGSGKWSLDYLIHTRSGKKV